MAWFHLFTLKSLALSLQQLSIIKHLLLFTFLEVLHIFLNQLWTNLIQSNSVQDEEMVNNNSNVCNSGIVRSQQKHFSKY